MDIVRRLEDEAVEPRHTTRFGGVDHGSTGRILAEVRRGNRVHRRLVWFKGTMTPAAGVRGFGHIYVPAKLQVIDGNGYWQGSVASGGRLSAARIAALAEEIDGHLGDGTAAALRIGRTLVVQEPHNDQRGDEA